MALLPALHVGVWNAWVLLIYYPLSPLLMFLIDRVAGTGHILQKLAGSSQGPGGQLAAIVASVLTCILVLISIFIPLTPRTPWFGFGLGLYFLGLVAFLAAGVTVATTPPGEPFVRGAYRYSRHPMYVFSFITFLGAGIAASAWCLLLLTGLLTLLFPIYAAAEERECLHRFGETYSRYMHRTPRWIGLPHTRSDSKT